MKSPGCILFCSCSGRDFLPEEKKRAIADGLEKSGLKFTTVPDLCGMSAKNQSALKEIGDRGEKNVVIACYPRAVKWLFAMAGIEWDTGRMHVINARVENTERVIEQVQSLDINGVETDAGPLAVGGDDPWIPGFPVIDYERCTNCRQCMNFCLFGVFSEDDNGKVKVKNPSNCKNNCPACARICPAAAIIFPKYPDTPINGAEIENEAEIREKIRINVNEILGNDIYAALSERRKKAKKLLSGKNDIEEAERERKKYSGQE